MVLLLVWLLTQGIRKVRNQQGKVVTGAAADKWASVVGNYTVTVAYTDTTVKVMVVDQNTSSNPSISDDSLYGVILSEPYKDKNADDEDIVVIDKFLTENGVENTRVYWPSEEGQPQALDMLHKKEIDMVVNIPKNLTAGELDNGYKSVVLPST